MKTVFQAGTAAICMVLMSAGSAANAQVNDGADARLALATEVVDDLLPDGFYRKMMEDTMDQMMNQVMGSMMDMTPADMGVDASMSEEARAATEGKSMREVATAADPAFEERMQITMKIMNAEMANLMEKIEPSVKSALSQSYARRFSADELTDIAGFFDTPSGGKFAAAYMATFTDPEMMQAMQAFVPEIMQAMPGIMVKVQEATAHLPPVKKPGE
ncbi:DUF2059 domain-containing protein [Pacificimonas sp. WHA3]|uniref:DUF2059 domain-containing protein n=1 Tax=Pacificimonas pallii TaxID=2827236 RepID=A0ABS6SA33_9SPHN|nr:DUF2059 domain-containing protein [Pacificimonas pallii]MBV7255233.1 DUF2059 domain-containing protein [Pacificimonas pallii]